ncbi:MAG: CPBP family intramembrane metalloprotease [Planctomycetes bacterium]|nr:CPBP family intramembrane metalloprotease [Planctomycetota bacterium]
MQANGTTKQSVHAWIQSVRPAPLWFLVLAIVVYMVLSYLVNLVVSPSELLPSLPAATGYVIAPTFLNYIPPFIIMGLLLVLVGRLRCNDLGLIRQRFLPAVAWVLCTWIAAQLFFLLTHLGDVSLDPVWDGQIVRTISTTVTGQMLGNALYEEVFWRAFVISQVVLLLVHRMKWTFGKSLAWAIILSSILFAVSHLPHDFAHDLSGQKIFGLQVARLAGGLAFAGIFLLSNNIFIVIGIHSLSNYSLSLFEGSNSELTQAFITLAPLLVLVILAIRRRRASR